MARTLRTDVKDTIYHVINRANARIRLFKSSHDYLAFEKVIEEAKERTNMRILAYCIMPNHWHFALDPREDGDLAKFIGWLTLTHTTRYHALHKTIGSGHLYQGRYKSFIVQEDRYFLQLVRYIEQNPLRAKLVKQSQDWRWSSIWRRIYGTKEQKGLLSKWPTGIPDDYMEWVNKTPDDEELGAIRVSMKRGSPFGSECWVQKIVSRFGLESTVRKRGRPRKGS